MLGSRLRLALELLRPSDWERFERLASSFLAAEFDDLRTVAAPSGDEGRDSELFSPGTEPSVVLQYSVAGDWTSKIRLTAARLAKTLPDARILVYLSNQAIAAAADDLKRELRKNGVALDVRDKSWFLDRVNGSRASERAGEELAVAIVDPYLTDKGISHHPPAQLTSPEAVAALTFLGLQWQDDIRDKGLTRVAFEALVRAVLANTDNDSRLARAQVHQGVRRLLPGHSTDQVDKLVDSALKRLLKRAVRHWMKEDEFCLAHSERVRVREFKTEAAIAEAELMAAVSSITDAMVAGVKGVEAHRDELAACVRATADAILFEKSQAFAAAVQTGTQVVWADGDHSTLFTREVARTKLPKVRNVNWFSLLEPCVREVLQCDDPAIQRHMRCLADAYTLLAFLRQTPDVQRAVEKMFSHGQVWLDASVTLPLLAETLLEPDPGRFTRMIRAADDAGLELFVTSGIVEEIERHMNRSLTCARMRRGGWVGPMPYLLSRFIASGRSPLSFGSWLERFRGDARPEQDIKDYLREEWHIETRELLSEREATSPELRHALQIVWHEAHKRRREQYGVSLDEMTITRLVEHDVECYCGVTHLRKNEHSSPFGYSAWWLTVDRQAFELYSQLEAAMGERPPDSPVLSADFLVNYLAFGPVRRRVGKASESHLPLMMELETARYLTPELLEEAEKLRNDLKGMPERAIRRRVRDHLDRARRRLGPIARAGVRELDDELA
ncbi:MAG: hypothetical protein U0166_02705 [Acidobacteriota bacterium]